MKLFLKEVIFEDDLWFLFPGEKDDLWLIRSSKDFITFF